MEVKFYSFSKRNKSSKLPTAPGTVVDVELKDNCDIEHPVLILGFEPISYNYIYIQKWNRYYFISSQSYYHGRWEIGCTEDYLASWITDIKNTRAYVLYDDNTYDLIDKRYVTLASPTITHNSEALRADFMSAVEYITGAAGSYMLTAVGEDKITTYQCSKQTIDELMVNYNNWFVGDVPNPQTTPAPTSVLDALKNLFDVMSALIKQSLGTGKANDNIKVVKYLPIKAPTPSVSDPPIKLGLYQSQKHGKDVGVNHLDSRSITIDIPWQVNDWRRNSPYTQIYVFIPFVGLVHYAASDLINVNQLTINSTLNYTTGDITIKVQTPEITLGIYSGNASVDVPLGSASINPVSIGTTILKNSVGAGLAAATGGAFGATATMLNASAGLLGDLDLLDSTVGSLGNGTSLPYSFEVAVFCVYHDTIVAPSSGKDIIGMPSMFVKSLSDASGFIQTAGFQIDCDGLASEKDAINELMDSGVYIE